MTEEEGIDYEPPLLIGAVTREVQIQNDECYVTLPVQGHLMRLKVDTGSLVNIMPLKELRKIEGDNPQMDPCNQKLVRCQGTRNYKISCEIQVRCLTRADIPCSGNKSPTIGGTSFVTKLGPN